MITQGFRLGSPAPLTSRGCGEGLSSTSVSTTGLMCVIGSGPSHFTGEHFMSARSQVRTVTRPLRLVLLEVSQFKSLCDRGGN